MESNEDASRHRSRLDCIKNLVSDLRSAPSTRLEYFEVNAKMIFFLSFNLRNNHAITHMIYIFFYIPRIFLEQNTDMPRIFLEHECIFCE